MMLYLLKINIALMILYGFYRLSISRDTFFSLRRFTLWLIYLVAVLTPTLNISFWVKESPTMTSMATAYADTFYPMPVFVDGSTGSLTWTDALLGIYLAGVVILSLRFLWQLLSICWLAGHSPKEKVEDTVIYRLKGENNPFSFFQWIFIGEKAPTHNHQALTGEELHEILVHEQTHARQYHSLDCILAEFFAIGCWFNPFAWLMRQEVRINLEFLADESVLAEGNARKSYQYHLLGLAYRKPAHSTEIANNFNLLPLKTRIKMMNKRRTQEIGKMKYLLFVPLTAALLAVSNIETVAREMSEYIPEIKTISETVSKTMNTKVVTMTPLAQSATRPDLSDASDVSVLSETSEKSEGAEESDSTKVYDMVREMPQFPGGMKALRAFISDNIQYPKAAFEAKKQGHVIASFIVNEKGKVTNIKIVRSIDPELDAEAIRIISSMPEWIPGKEDGKAVSVKYAVPITFRLYTPAQSTGTDSIKSALPAKAE